MIKSIINTSLTALVATVLLLTSTLTAFADSDDREKEAKDRMSDAKELLEELNQLIDEAAELDDDINLDDYRDAVEDGQELYDEAVTERTKEDWRDVLELATEAYELLKDPVDDLEDDLDDAIENVMERAEDLVESADKALDEHDNKNSDYEKARDFFEDARSKFNKAEDYQEDYKYNLAKHAAEQVEFLIQEALDEVDINLDTYREQVKDQKEAREAVKQAEARFNEADTYIKTTDYQNKDQKNKHEDYLGTANQYLTEAQEEYDDMNYSKATTLAKRALTQAERIVNDTLEKEADPKKEVDDTEANKAVLQKQIDQLLELIKLLTQLLAQR